MQLFYSGKNVLILRWFNKLTTSKLPSINSGQAGRVLFRQEGFDKFGDGAEETTGEIKIKRFHDSVQK